MVSEAQKRAKNKYNKKAYKNWSVRLKPFELETIEKARGTLSRREWLLKIAAENKEEN